MRQRITIKNLDKPREINLKENVRWICNSLGLMNGRDTECISFKVLYELLNLVSEQDLVSTEVISKSLKLEPYVINHHVRGLMESGIIIREKRKIALRGKSLSGAIEELKKDSELMFNRLLEVSKKVDNSFEL